MLYTKGRNLFVRSTAVPGYPDWGGTIHSPDRYNLTSDYIPVNAGEKITAQMWNDDYETYQPWWCLQYFDAEKTYVSQPFREIVSEEHKAVSATIPQNASYIRFGARYMMDGHYHTRLKLEFGDEATDWRPAPEDAQMFGGGVELYDPCP